MNDMIQRLVIVDNKTTNILDSFVFFAKIKSDNKAILEARVVKLIYSISTAKDNELTLLVQSFCDTLED